MWSPPTIPQSRPDPEPEPEYRCERCRDRGWYLIADGGAGTAARCSCDTLLRQDVCKVAGVPERHWGSRFETYQTNLPDADATLHAKNLKRLVKEWASAWTKNTRTGLLLCGPGGTGKTHLAVSALRVAGLRGASCRYLSVTSYVADSRQSYHGTVNIDSLQAICSAGLLLIDDLGAPSPTTYATDIQQALIFGRYDTGLPALVTSMFEINPGTDKRTSLASRIGEASVSRLQEMARALIIPPLVADWRRAVAAVLAEEC